MKTIVLTNNKPTEYVIDNAGAHSGPYAVGDATNGMLTRYPSVAVQFYRVNIQKTLAQNESVTITTADAAEVAYYTAQAATLGIAIVVTDEEEEGEGEDEESVPKTVTYNANGGIGTAIVDDTVVGETYVVLDNADLSTPFIREGYTFKNWDTVAEGTGTSYDPGDEISITDNVVLYAIWEEVVVPKTVTYKANSGVGDDIVDDTAVGETYVVLDNSALSTPFTKADSTFEKWNTAAEGTGTSYDPGDEISITDNVVLYAIWDSGT